jgi:hypothetical protein
MYPAETAHRESWQFKVLYTGWMNPIRMCFACTYDKNPFAEKVRLAESLGAKEYDLMDIRGRNRARQGIFEGNIEEGMLEAGQSSGLVKDIIPVDEIFRRIIGEYDKVRSELPSFSTET